MNDLLEELVGDLDDDSSVPEESPVERLQDLADSRYHLPRQSIKASGGAPAGRSTIPSEDWFWAGNGW